MIKVILTLSLLVAVSFSFPQGPPTQGNPPGPGCLLPSAPPGAFGPPPPGPQGQGPPQGFQGPGGPQPPPCPATLVSGNCGGKQYFWDTAKESEPEDFKKCFYGDGPVGATCNGTEYTWDPAKEAKSPKLEACEKDFLARQQGAPKPA